MLQCRSKYYIFFVIPLALIFMMCISLAQRKEYEKILYSCQTQSLSNFSLLNTNESVSVHDQNTFVDELSILCFDIGLNLNWERFFPLSVFLQAPVLNSTTLTRIPYRYSYWESSSPFSRVLTQCEHSLLMRLLIVIEHICRQNQITFFMAYGTLIGSWRHHDVIPWDGDVDLLLSILDKPRVFTILKSLNSSLIQFNIYRFSEASREYFKISFKAAHKAGSRPWRFPFVDIFFYHSNDTHIWLRHHKFTSIEKAHIFPLEMRPFGQLWLPSPRYPKYILPSDIENICIKSSYDYRTESFTSKHITNCSQLKKVYPFVSRNNTQNLTEILKRDDHIIQTVIYQ